MDVVARRGKLIGEWATGKKDFAQTEGSKQIETFLNGEIEVAPECGQRADDRVGQHDDEGMALCARLQPDVDGPHLKMHGLTLSEGPLDIPSKMPLII